MNVEPSFPHSYRCAVRRELSVSLPQWNFGKGDGVIVEVEPEQGLTWQGVFGFGEAVANRVTALSATPDPNVLCVVARGAGYLVEVEDPSRFEEIECRPILGLHAVANENVLLLHDFVHFVAYDDRGLAWKSPRISWDGIREVRIDVRTIRAQVWRGEDWIETELELFS